MINMRVAVIAVGSFLLNLVSLFAQPVIGAEILSQPLPARNARVALAAPAVAMARDQHGVVIAWTMRNASGDERISVARLDAAGQVRGPVAEIPLLLPGDGIDAIYPSIARSETGSGFTLGWIELLNASVTNSRAVYCQLDADLEPSAPHAIPTRSVLAKPVLVRSGTATWLASGGLVSKLGTDGSIETLLDAGVQASDMVATEPFPQLISGQKIVEFVSCQQPCPGSDRFTCPESCRVFQSSFDLGYVAINTFSTFKTFLFDSDTQPAVESDGHDVLFTWFRGDESAGGQVVGVRLEPPSFVNFILGVDQPQILGTFRPDSGPTRPVIATDGERYLVVWRTTSARGDHDIVGSSIDRAGIVTHLSIATSVADERDPSVIAIGSGTFLVAYEKLNAAERRIAGRFVTFGSRRRAAR